MNWIGDDDLRCAVFEDGDGYTIFRAARDGSLAILGERWKECLGSRCRRGGSMPEKCGGCGRGPAHLRDQAQAVRVAEGIAEMLGMRWNGED